MSDKLIFVYNADSGAFNAIKDVPLPAAFIHCMGQKPKLWLEAGKINSCKSLEDLKQLVVNNIS